MNTISIAEILEHMGVMEHEINEVERAVRKEIAIYKEEGEDYDLDEVIVGVLRVHREKQAMEDLCRMERGS